jgi:adenosyl cobinamide kinase/adenosyl cobinamide phosphate guanylyltransferase
MTIRLRSEPVYVATAMSWDEDFAKRVNRHKAERSLQWTSYEAHQCMPTTAATQNSCDRLRDALADELFSGKQ